MTHPYPEPRAPEFDEITTVEELMPSAREIVERPGTKSDYLTTGYGMVEPGMEVLMAVRSIHNELVVEALTRALRETGAEVDVLEVDVGPDEERTEGMDIDLAITTDPGSGEDAYSEYLGRFYWVDDLAEDRDYDLLIQCTAGPILPHAHRTGEPFYMERIAWQSPEEIVSDASHFPQELLYAITEKTQRLIIEHAPGAEVHLTDPEGTDISFTFHEEYFENSPDGKSISQDVWDEYYADYDWPIQARNRSDNHVAGRPFPPLLDKEDATGVVAATIGHHSIPYPRIRIHIEDGKVTEIEGGGEKGEKMRALMDETADTQYPDFPGPGLLWWWECSIGTNPKVFRASNFRQKSGPGMLTERLRSGVIHVGIGTRASTYSEHWAADNGLVYGHVDQHLNFPTYTIDTGDEEITVIEDGHLAALDDPEVREIAAKYGDPDELLTEAWIPHLPGVNAPGDYDEYAAAPADYLDRFLAG